MTHLSSKTTQVEWIEKNLSNGPHLQYFERVDYGQRILHLSQIEEHGFFRNGFCIQKHRTQGSYPGCCWCFPWYMRGDIMTLAIFCCFWKVHYFITDSSKNWFYLLCLVFYVLAIWSLNMLSSKCVVTCAYKLAWVLISWAVLLCR